uniref:Ankyrin repeat and SOCS box containing 3 n=1 Tax=Erpetoichthys calabaricus TaxID=27687 RepID=A0A8C4XBK9_ERPCA
MNFGEAYRDTCSVVGIAAREDNHKVLEKLIKQGRRINIADNRGWMPTHEAAYSDAHKSLRLLIKAGNSSSYLNSKTFEGQTALHLAASRGNVRSSEILLKAGAQVNETTNELETPLFLAIGSGNTDTVNLLIEHGANVNGSHSLCGWNSLHQAAFQVNLFSFLKILKKRRSLSTVCKLTLPTTMPTGMGRPVRISNGDSPNCRCVRPLNPIKAKGSASGVTFNDVINLYLNRILEKLIPITNRICDTGIGKVSPVYSAVLGDQEDCLKILLREGYSPNAQECMMFGYTSPLSTAIARVSPNMAYVLLESKAFVSGSDYSSCLRQGHMCLFHALLKQGCPLPSEKHLEEFIQLTLHEDSRYKEWLPHLLLAGFNPLHLLSDRWIQSVSYDVLNFILGFTDWKRLPTAISLFIYLTIFLTDSLPGLAHLCRLKIRVLLKSERLRTDKYIRQLPLPSCLHDFLLYSDVLLSGGLHILPASLWDSCGYFGFLPQSKGMQVRWVGVAKLAPGM